MCLSKEFISDCAPMTKGWEYVLLLSRAVFCDSNNSGVNVCGKQKFKAYQEKGFLSNPRTYHRHKPHVPADPEQNFRRETAADPTIALRDKTNFTEVGRMETWTCSPRVLRLARGVVRFTELQQTNTMLIHQSPVNHIDSSRCRWRTHPSE